MLAFNICDNRARKQTAYLCIAGVAQSQPGPHVTCRNRLRGDRLPDDGACHLPRQACGIRREPPLPLHLKRWGKRASIERRTGAFHDHEVGQREQAFPMVPAVECGERVAADEQSERPAGLLAVDGLSVQVTAVFTAFATFPVNCCVCPL